MAHGYSGGNGEWPPPSRRDARDPNARDPNARGGQRRAPEESFNGFAERKPPPPAPTPNGRRGVPPEPPGARNGMLASPRGAQQPPRRGGAMPPGAVPPNGIPPRVGRPGQGGAPPVSPPPAGVPRRGAPAQPRQSVPPRPGPYGMRLAPPAPGRPMGPPQRTVGAPPRPRPDGAPPRRWARISHNPQRNKRWKAGLSVLGVVLVLAVCAIGSYMIVLDEQKGVQAQANSSAPKPTSTPVDISSRKIDPEPLTAKELFPGKTIVVDPNKPDEVYTLINSQELTECKTATEGDITKLIAELGCSQVVRGTLNTPAEGYVVTGGVMNLETSAGAEKAWEEIGKIVKNQKGRFVGYVVPSDKTTKPLALASTVVGWAVKGHYVAYCVIARTDSKAIPDNDPFAEQIMFDIVQYYFKEVILEARASDPVSEATPAPSGSPGA